MSEQSQPAHGQRRRAQRAALPAGHLTPLKSPASLGLMWDQHKSEREGGEKCVEERGGREEGGWWSGKDKDEGVWWDNGGKKGGEGGIDLIILTKRTRNDWQNAKKENERWWRSTSCCGIPFGFVQRSNPLKSQILFAFCVHQGKFFFINSISTCTHSHLFILANKTFDTYQVIFFQIEIS